MRRRDVLTLLAAGAALPLATPAHAVTVPDLGIFCDPTLRPVMLRICSLWADKTGVPARVLCAPGALMVQQLVRNARNDILITRADSMDGAAAAGMIKPETRVELWNAGLVLAVRTGVGPAAPASLAAGGNIAAPDPTPAATFDGAAVLAQLGVPVERVIGAADTGDVVHMVTSGAAHAGLVYGTDVFAEPGLVVGSAVPGAVRFSAAQSRTVQSWRAADFLTFLASPEAMEAARDGGLERLA